MVLWIPYEHFGPGVAFKVNLDPNMDPDPIRNQGFDDQNFKNEKIQVKCFVYFFDQKLQFTSLGLHKGRPSYRSSLQPSKENIQYFKKRNLLTFFYFCGSFVHSWIRIVNPDTDPGTTLNPDSILIHKTGQEDQDPEESFRPRLLSG